MLPSSLVVLRVLVWLQAWLLAAAAVAALVLAALLLPSVPADDGGGFAGLGRDLFHLALAGAAVTAVPALLLGVAVRWVRDAGGAAAVAGVAVILVVEAAVTVGALWSVTRVGTAGPAALAVTTVPAVLLALSPSSLRWIRLSREAPPPGPRLGSGVWTQRPPRRDTCPGSSSCSGPATGEHGGAHGR